MDKNGVLVEGGIKEHTVRPVIRFMDVSSALKVAAGSMHHQPRERVECHRLVLGEGCESQCLPEEHG